MRVLVATDLSDSADDALRQAAGTLEVAGAVAICHVVPHLQTVAPLFPQRAQEMTADTDAMLEPARAAVQAHVRECMGLKERPFEVFIDRGTPHVEIARRAELWHADLVLVGSRGLSGLRRVLLGSVAELVARYASCPVLVARPSGAGPVVAATDLSDPSLPAIVRGAEEAKRRNVALRVLHVVDLGPQLAWAPGAPFGAAPIAMQPDDIASIQSGAEERLRAAMTRAGVLGEARVLLGDPTGAIVGNLEVEQAQLVVVGTHGRTGLSRLAIGSVAEKVIRAAPCSVLVVRHAGEVSSV